MFTALQRICRELLSLVSVILILARPVSAPMLSLTQPRAGVYAPSACLKGKKQKKKTPQFDNNIRRASAVT